jgi:hypothetical protein
MKRCAVYEASTGRIKQVVSGSPRSVSLTLASFGEGHGILALRRDESTEGKAVRGGQLVEAGLDRGKALRKLRIARNIALARDVDPMLGNAERRMSLTDDQRRAWRAYRRALLDITKGDVFAPDWPRKPE